VRAHLVPEKVDVDITSATESQVRAAVEAIVAEDESRGEAEALERLSDAVGTGRGVVGVDDTLQALNERRVQVLLLSPNFDGHGRRCPTCGMLVGEDTRRCPADGTNTDEVEHVREAAVEAALAQDAEIMVTAHHDDQPRHGIAAILRF
jgi:peptide chain release factor subunit 1